MLQPLPTALRVLLERLFKTGGRGDHAIVPAGGIFITLPIQRRQNALVELGTFLKHSLRCFQPGICKRRDLRELRNISQMLNVEQHVFEGGFVSHGVRILVQMFREKNQINRLR